MKQSELICKWITDKVKEGRGAVIFSLEENDGMVGVWVGEPAEHERALGYGDDVFMAVLDAMKRDAELQRASENEQNGAFACANCGYLASDRICTHCGTPRRPVQTARSR